MNVEKLSELLELDRVAMLETRDKKTALQELVELLSKSASSINPEELMEVLLAREAIMSTGVGLGIAVPHARLKLVDQPILAVGLSRDGIKYESLDDKPVHIVVLIVVPLEAQKQYLRILARVTLLLKNPKLRDRLIQAKDAIGIYKILTEY